jgi:hypothetical protein
MKHFIKTTSGGLIKGYTFSDFMSQQGWIEVNAAYSETVGRSTFFRHTPSGPVDTGIPSKPTHFGYVFDEATEVWKDARTTAQAWADVRVERDKRLLESDWTQLPDVPLATKDAWATYRQALRDVTEQPDPFNIVWPTPPG